DYLTNTAYGARSQCAIETMKMIRWILNLSVLVGMSVLAVGAQAPGGRGGPALMTLPLANLGLEHLDIVVPDTAESAKFYMRIFKAPLHQQPVRDTVRYFLVLGDVPADRQVGYVAIG